MFTGILKLILIAALIVICGFVLLHVFPYLLAVLAALGLWKLCQAWMRDKGPPPPRWP